MLYQRRRNFFFFFLRLKWHPCLFVRCGWFDFAALCVSISFSLRVCRYERCARAMLLCLYSATAISQWTMPAVPYICPVCVCCCVWVYGKHTAHTYKYIIHACNFMIISKKKFAQWIGKIGNTFGMIIHNHNIYIYIFAHVVYAFETVHKQMGDEKKNMMQSTGGLRILTKNHFRLRKTTKTYLIYIFNNKKRRFVV